MGPDDEILGSRDRIFEDLGRITLALAAPVRLRIVQVLANRPSTVETISKSTGQTIGNTSQHLQKMLQAGLVKVARKGVCRIYSLKTPNVADLWFSLQQLAPELNPAIREHENILAPTELCTEIPASEILNMAERRNATLVDVRTTEESQSTPVPFSLHIPADTISKRLRELPKSKPVFIFCRGRYCAMANPAVRFLRKRGYEAYRLRESALEFK